MVHRFACALVLLCGVAAGQDHTIPVSSLHITATISKKIFRHPELIKINLKISNPLPYRLRVPAFLKVMEGSCAAHTPAGKWVECGLDEGFEIDLHPLGGENPAPEYAADALIVGDPPTFKEKSIILRPNDFYGTEITIVSPRKIGKYVLSVTYHAWDKSKLREDDLALVQKEDCYAPVGDFRVSDIPITIEP